MRQFLEAVTGLLMLYGVIAWLLFALTGINIFPGPLVSWPQEYQGYSND